MGAVDVRERALVACGVYLERGVPVVVLVDFPVAARAEHLAGWRGLDGWLFVHPVSGGFGIWLWFFVVHRERPAYGLGVACNSFFFEIEIVIFVVDN